MMAHAPSELLERARAARRNAYAPYSGFTVGAALAARSGEVYLGVNVENASYGVALCAERSALAAAVTAGEREFEAIAVAGPEGEKTLPCGICRQALAEFGDLTIVFAEGENAGKLPLSKLFPHPFALQVPR
jgi:cytidine deaminase